MTSFVLVEQILNGHYLHNAIAYKLVYALFAHDVLVGWVVTFDVDVALDKLG